MRKIAQKLMISVFAVAFAVIALGTSTFAWFTLSNQAQINSFELTAQGGEGMQIQITAKGALPTAAGWRVGTITSSEIDRVVRAQRVILDGVTYNGNSQTFTQWSSSTSPNSTTVAFTPSPEEGVNNKYLEFDVHFRTEVNSSGTVYLTGDTTMGIPTTGANSTNNPWTADENFTLSAQDATNTDVTVAPNDQVTFDISSAARMKFTPVVTAEQTATVTIVEKVAAPATKSEVVDTVNYNRINAGNSTGFARLNETPNENATDTYFGAVQYYGIKTNHYSAVFGAVPTAYSTTGYIGDQNYQPLPLVTLTPGSNGGSVTGTVTVSIWLEGWDGEMMNSLLGKTLAVVLAFDLRQG